MRLEESWFAWAVTHVCKTVRRDDTGPDKLAVVAAR